MHKIYIWIYLLLKMIATFSPVSSEEWYCVVLLTCELSGLYNLYSLQSVVKLIKKQRDRTCSHKFEPTYFCEVIGF